MGRAQRPYWAAKPGKREAASNSEPTPAPGPLYDKQTLLKCFNLLGDAANSLGYGTRSESKPANEETEASIIEQRRALREFLKDQRQAKKIAQHHTGAVIAIASVLPQTSASPMAVVCPLWGTTTTFKVENVPGACTQESLNALLFQFFPGALDFIYMPEAPEGSAEGVHNAGRAFLNFRFLESASIFMKTVNGAKVSIIFPGFELAPGESENICKVSKAHIPTLDETVEDLRQRASAGEAVRLPILVDVFGNTRPLFTGGLCANAPEFIPANAAELAMRQQIEHYFSFDNMCSDVFLRSQMDEEGWVALSLVAGFPKVRAFAVSDKSLASYLINSDVVEVDLEQSRVRQKDAEQRVLWELKGALDGKNSSAS